LTVCTVQRCDQDVAGIFTTNEKILMETAVCGDHLQRLEAGEPWAYKGMSNELLMDSDLPPVIVNFKLDEGVGPGVTLTLSTEGNPTEQAYWLSKKHAQQLGSFLTGNL
jgi:hypothetical protein